MQRLMAALASRDMGVGCKKEALTLLNHGLGSERLLVQGRLQEYCACLAAVLAACAVLRAELASSLLMCFDMAGLCAAMMQAKPAMSQQVISRPCHSHALHCCQDEPVSYRLIIIACLQYQEIARTESMDLIASSAFLQELTEQRTWVCRSSWEAAVEGAVLLLRQPHNCLMLL